VMVRWGWSGRVRRAARRSAADRRIAPRTAELENAHRRRPTVDLPRLEPAVCCRSGTARWKSCGRAGSRRRRAAPAATESSGCGRIRRDAGTVPGDGPPVDTGGGAGPPPARRMPSVPSVYSPARKGGVTAGQETARRSRGLGDLVPGDSRGDFGHGEATHPVDGLDNAQTPGR
jgi:hypothetical protein